MTALVMQRLAEVLLKEGFVVKKIEDEQSGFYEKYTGRIIITVRPVDEEEADAEAARLRREKEKGDATQSNPEKKEVPF